MRRLLLFLLLLGLHSEAEADGRVAITGVPVVGGHRTLYTAPPSEESHHDDYGRPLSVPYPSTHYARNLPSHLTLGQGRIEGRPWYFNSNGYNSYHYGGEHYQPTGGLTESYSGYTNSCGHSYSGNYSGGNLRELWIPIDRPREPKMSVVTSPLAKYSGWYVNTPGFAGWLPGPSYIGPYGGYYDYLSRQPVWGQYQGHLYDKRLYREPPGGWEEVQTAVPTAVTVSVANYRAKTTTAPTEKQTDVGHYDVQSWAQDGRSFQDTHSRTWTLIGKVTKKGKPVAVIPATERTSRVFGYLVYDKEKDARLHLVHWDGYRWIKQTAWQ